MKILREIKLHLNRMKLLFTSHGTENQKSVIATNCLYYCCYFSFALTTGWFFLYADKTYVESIEALFVMLCSLLVFAWYTVFLLQNRKYDTLFNKLESFIEKGMEDPLLSVIYQETNEKIEYWSKKFYFTIYVSTCLYSFFPVATSCYKYTSSGGSNDSFHQIYPATFPFEWKTPTGYIGCVFMQILHAYTGAELFASAIVLTVALCLLINSLVLGLKEKIRQFNVTLFAWKNEKKPRKKNALMDKLKKELGVIIQFNMEAREIFQLFSDTNEQLVFAYQVFIIASFGIVASQIKTIFESNAVEMVHIMIWASVYIPTLLTVCHFGGNVTQQFEDVGNAVYQLEWYDLPVDMQKDLKVIIALAQKRIFMRGFGDTRTTHSVFKKIVKNKFMYFLLARKL